jgi:hypothetical protein
VRHVSEFQNSGRSNAEVFVPEIEIIFDVCNAVGANADAILIRQDKDGVCR